MIHGIMQLIEHKHKKVFIFLIGMLALFGNCFCSTQSIRKAFISDTAAAEETAANQITTKTKKALNFILYIAADNDLDPFARNSIYQLALIGSSNEVNILIHLDIQNNNQKITKWYYVEKNHLLVLNANDPSTQAMDSGDPNTLIRWIDFVMKNFPAEHNILIFWNHGSGCLDPARSRSINIADYFIFNPQTRKYDLDRSIGYLDLITERGICWDDTTGNFLTNQKLEYALRQCCLGSMDGKIFDIIGFDACLMGMAEIADIVQPYADMMIASEEVIPGTSWQYELIAREITHGNPDILDVAHIIIATYAKTYEPLTNDYTLSAIDLAELKTLERNISNVAQILIKCLENQKSNTVKMLLKWCRNKQNCTHFDEPRYLDLYDLYNNIGNKAKMFSFSDSNVGKQLQKDLLEAIEEGKKIIKKMVLANCTGSHLRRAQGISIYWPDDRIHESYKRTTFAQNGWLQFITTYLNA